MSEDTTVTGTFDGTAITAPAGASVAAALLTSGRRSWRTTRGGRQRGLFCGIGVCFDCLVEIDGQTGQRACLIALEDGMEVRSHRGAGEENTPTHPDPSRADHDSEGGERR